MIVKTAWKNVWRNKTRSFVVIISVTIGIFSGIYGLAIMNGVIKQKFDSTLNQEIAHIQISHPKFRANNEIKYQIENTKALEDKLKTISGIDCFAPRIVLNGMANSASKSAGVQIIGILPEQEKKVLNLDKRLMPETGRYLEDNPNRNYAFIGKELAKELNIISYFLEESDFVDLKKEDVPEEIIEKLKIYSGKRFKNENSFNKAMQTIFNTKEEKKYGNTIKTYAETVRGNAKFTLSFVDKDNYQTGALFRVCGIYNTSNNVFEKTQVFINKSTLEELSQLPEDNSHQLLIKTENLEEINQIKSEIEGFFPSLEVIGWKEIQPELAMMTEMIGLFYMVFMLIILAALAFGIVNTMLMVVLERTKELGMLQAIGMNKKKVFKMIIYESIFLSLIGGITGMIISKLLIVASAHNGINFSSYAEGFEAMGYTAHIFPEISNAFFFTVTIMIVITGVLSAIYPALKALKLNPADAIRTE